MTNSQKKTYETPAIDVVEVEFQASLLVGTPGGGKPPVVPDYPGEGD